MLAADEIAKYPLGMEDAGSIFDLFVICEDYGIRFIESQNNKKTVMLLPCP